jgi:hypothetical protein
MNLFPQKLNSFIPRVKRSSKAIIFIFLALIAIPITVGIVNRAQDLRSRAEIPRPNLQMSFFTPETYRDELAAEHIPGEIIVKYVASVSITTRSEINQNTQSFTVDDIVSGLPDRDLYNLKQAQVLKIEKVFKNINPNGNNEETNLLLNVYKLTVPNNLKLDDAMQKICSTESLVYCEPNYKLSPALEPIKFFQSQVFAECVGEECNAQIEIGGD